ncbi:hypothetical protein ACIP79_00855 [Streptomyces sp. NPDC088747]|uniref:hypothetical protein n=1 Tax=Streptomyces sp. NPDC088747 TaxID=3365886 RepID=UPI0038158DAB
MKAYKVKGTTNDVTTCDQCSRVELKGTVVMAALDADGNEEEILYFGTSCAARASGWTQREIKARAKTADTEKREAARRIRDEESRRYCAARDAYFLNKYGTKSHFDVAWELGVKAHTLLMEFDAQYKATS